MPRAECLSVVSVLNHCMAARSEECWLHVSEPDQMPRTKAGPVAFESKLEIRQLGWLHRAQGFKWSQELRTAHEGFQISGSKSGVEESHGRERRTLLFKSGNWAVVRQHYLVYSSAYKFVTWSKAPCIWSWSQSARDNKFGSTLHTHSQNSQRDFPWQTCNSQKLHCASRLKTAYSYSSSGLRAIRRISATGMRLRLNGYRI